jgi:demethylsterigmatocystin 6-O-methyltransferase
VKNNYQNLTGGHCAWNSAFSTDLDFFPWAKSNPDILGYFQQLMSVPREGNWLDVMGESFEVAASSISKGQSEETVQNGADERALFVDIGGNIGHQCARLKARYPELKGKVVLQDREETIARAPKIEGVEFMVHDFFTEQPVKGEFSLSFSCLRPFSQQPPLLSPPRFLTLLSLQPIPPSQT